MDPIVILLVHIIQLRMKGLDRGVAVNRPYPAKAGRVRTDLIPAMPSRHRLGGNPDLVLPIPLADIEKDSSLGTILPKDLPEEGHGFPQDLRWNDRKEEICAFLLFLEP